MLAVTLARTDFREADQLIALYTLDQGKMEVVARGIKKNIAKNAPALEPFSLIDVELAPGRELTYVTKATIVESYIGIRSSLSSIGMAGAALSLVQRLVAVGERDAALFELVISFLKSLRADSVSTLPLSSFIVRLLHTLGFVPVLDRCVRCGKKRHSTPRYVFAVDLGGLLCSECREAHPNNTLLPLAAPALALLIELQRADWAAVHALRADAKNQKTVEKLLKLFTLYHTNHPAPFGVLNRVLAT